MYFVFVELSLFVSWLLVVLGLFISPSTHPLHLPSSVDKQRVCSQVILHLQLYNNYHSKYDNERPRDSEAEHFFPSYFQSVSSQRWKWPLMMTVVIIRNDWPREDPVYVLVQLLERLIGNGWCTHQGIITWKLTSRELITWTEFVKPESLTYL